jgi:hypothetical protein
VGMKRAEPLIMCEKQIRSTPHFRLMIILVIVAYVPCACEGIRQLNKIQSRNTKEGIEIYYESIFRKGYTCLNLVAQQIERFLLHLINTLGKPIRTLKPS